jgi:hypothetical protein
MARGDRRGDRVHTAQALSLDPQAEALGSNLSLATEHYHDSNSQCDQPPPYLLHTSQLFSTPHVTAALKGRFQDSEDINKNATAELYAGPWDIFSANFRKM